MQEREEQVALAVQQVSAALQERSQAEQAFYERYVTGLDANRQQLEQLYITDAIEFNVLKDQ